MKRHKWLWAAFPLAMLPLSMGQSCDATGGLAGLAGDYDGLTGSGGYGGGYGGYGSGSHGNSGGYPTGWAPMGDPLVGAGAYPTFFDPSIWYFDPDPSFDPSYYGVYND
ncbi:MAG: hypothetical protein HRF43_10650 [Phycisphaerae bacterium]|jgi:hypothetical protein